MKKYGFIGCGNMGSALVRAAVESVQSDEIFVCDKDASKPKALSDELGVNISNTKLIAEECDYIFIGVKPQMLSELLSEIACILSKRKDRFVLVTMAAGISVRKLSELIGAEYPIIRIMPNIPASCGEGMILYCANKQVLQDELDGFIGLMNKSGRLAELEEKLIDAGSAISGCGPAYVSMFIEALADGGVRCGLPRDKAVLLASQTLLGTAKMIIETDIHPEEMKDAVCSPAGTTIAGVGELENGAFRAVVQNAIIAAYERSLELGK